MYKSWLPKLKSIAISLLYRRPRRRWVQKRLIMNLSLYIFGNTWFGVLPHKALPNLEELFNQLIHCRHIVTVYIFGGTSTAVSSHKALPNLEELPNQLIHCWNVIFARSSPALSLSCTAVHKLLDEHCRQVASTAITLLLLLYLIWKLFSINSHSHYSQSGTNGSVKYVIVDGVGSYPFCLPNRSSISHSPGSSTSAPLGLTPLPTLTSGAVQGVHNGIVGSVSRPPPLFLPSKWLKCSWSCGGCILSRGHVTQDAIKWSSWEWKRQGYNWSIRAPTCWRFTSH